MTLFSVIYRPISQKRYLLQNSVLFSMDSSAGDIFFLVGHLILCLQSAFLSVSSGSGG